MRFNKFYISIFLRIVLIVITGFLFVYFFERDDNLLTTVFIVFLVLVQIAFLIKYVNRTNRELAEFLIHLQQGDTSLVFCKENIEKTFKGLRDSFEKINIDLKQIRSEKEQKEHYLKYVIDNIKTGLLAFNESGEIEFVNNQAKTFLNKENLRLLNINSLESEFVKVLNDTKLSESNILKKTINDELYYLAFTLSQFKIENKNVKLFTIHNVRKEIESNEIESWQKLTSVLTHEMMNSITPITSLAHAIKRYLRNDTKLLSSSEINNELIADIVENADIIESRGKGLLEFINNYRTITKLPKPKFELIETEVFFQKIIKLFNNKQKEILIKINVDTNLDTFLADRGMIEQVIINLVKNSAEALTNVLNPQIEIKITADNFKNPKIQVIDNGQGISSEIIDNIFIPFFTTKEKGSGVGLSISRQIMYLHGGSISVKSVPLKETIFTIQF